MILDKFIVDATEDQGATLKLKQSTDRTNLPASIAAALKSEETRVRLSMSSGGDTSQMTEIDTNGALYVLFITPAELATAQAGGLSVPSS